MTRLTTISALLASTLLLAGLARYFAFLPHIFDLAFDDELVYMGVGTDFGHLIQWPAGFPGIYASYENGGFYSSIYGALSAFFADPIDLYFYGGTIVVLLAVLLGFAGSLLLSDSLLVAIAITCPVILSGELMTWPRVSFAAIAIIALGFAAMARLGSVRIKVAILLCAAYLAAFVRPEFVLSFYALLALQLGLLGVALYRLRRGPPVARADFAAMGLALGFVAILSAAWSFPVLEGGERAFVAFGAHYAVQYGATHKLDIDPWIDWRVVMAQQFPGAGTVYQAFRVAPDKVLLYFANNLQELAGSIGTIIGGTARRYPIFAAIWTACVLVWAVSAYRRRGTAPAADKRRWIDLALVLAFAAPPAIATVTIFPRHHYIVLLLFAGSSALAVLARPMRTPVSATLATIIAGAFAVSVAPTPAVPQPLLDSVRALRAQPPVRRMFEIDGGWCYLVMPRCIEDYAEWMPDGASFDAYRRERGIDSIMLSPRLTVFETTHAPDFPQQVEQLKTTEGWQSTELGNGYVLLRAPPKTGS